MLALAANLASVLLLGPYRDGDAHVRSVLLSSRNDAIGNVIVIVMAAAFGAGGTSTAWPDLAVAAIMAGISLTSPVQILRQAWREHRHGDVQGHWAPAEERFMPGSDGGPEPARGRPVFRLTLGRLSYRR